MRDTKGRKRCGTSRFLLLVAALIGALVLTSCAGGGGNGGNGGNGEPSPPRPWIIRYGHPTNWSGQNGLDPQGVPGSSVPSLYSEGLLTRDQVTGAVLPGLATSWEVAPDWSYIDYVIRQGITFHNGDPMTAEDVKFSFERAMEEDINPLGWSTLVDLVDSVEIIDDYQVRVHLKKPGWSFLEGTPVIVPKNYIEEVGDEEFGLNPVGTGPFRVVDWEMDNYVHLEAIEDHWLHSPNYDELIFMTVLESTTRLAMLMAGELDMAAISPANIPDVDANPNLTKVMSTHSSLWCIEFYDLARPDDPSPWHDPLVRKAASLAIDRGGISENILFGTYIPWGSYFAPYQLGYRYRAPDAYDPDEARRLLAEAGYPDGFDTQFAFPTDRRLESEAVVVCLNAVGIRAEAEEMEPTTWAMRHLYGTHEEIGFTSFPMWGGAFYPSTSFGQEISAWEPVGRTYPEIEEAYNNLLWSITDDEIVQAAWAAEDLVWELGYKVPVWATGGAFAYGPTIEWWQPRPGVEGATGLQYIEYNG